MTNYQRVVVGLSAVLLASVTLSGQSGPPVSVLQGGHVMVVNADGSINATTAAPVGGATAANQTNGSQKTQVVDGSGNVIGSTSNALDVNIKSGNPTTMTVTQGTATNLKTQAEVYQGGSAVASGNPLQVTLANTGANSTAVKVDGSAVTQPVSNAGTFAVQATQSGTWTVQPGNTANTTAWLVTTRTAVTANAPTAASVGVASAQALAANASRKGLILVNTSANTISIGCGQTAVLSSGITLYPGGSYSMTEYDFCTGAINAIASSASSNLAIQEYQ